jgi:restriction system protein
MSGLKRVSQRRNDALSRVGWEQLESLLANYYRGRGYQVEEVGTGATGAKFDGGIDLKLRKDNEYILVQCKHWNAMKVTHNAVHELLGIMVNQGATGAILVSSGEFSKAAIEAATRQGHVQLIDGEELRAMIGPVPEPMAAASTSASASDYVLQPQESVGKADDRDGFGRRSAFQGALSEVLLKVGLLLLFAWFVFAVMGGAFQSVTKSLAPKPQVTPTPLPTANRAMSEPAVKSGPFLIDAYTGTTIENRPDSPSQPKQSKAEIREQKRKADEAAAILNAPEM